MNNWKNLGDDHEKEFNESPLGLVNGQRQLESTFGVFRHIGGVMDHFLGRALDMLITFSGGRASDSKTPPDQAGDPFEDAAPGRPR